MSHPSLPKDIIANTPMLYYRLHGEGQLYSSNYSDNELASFVTGIKKKDVVNEAYIFFNNDINTYAIYNSLTMKRLLDSKEH